MKKLSELRHLAELCGIQLYYKGAGGHSIEATDDSLRAMLHVLGVAARHGGEIRESVRIIEQGLWQRGVEPVIVAWQGRGCVKVRAPSTLVGALFECDVLVENGQKMSWSGSLNAGRSVGSPPKESVQYSSYRILFPELPFGCHKLTIQCRNQVWRAWIISAPSVSYSDPELEKSWGLFLPVHAAHSEKSWGAGNLSDYLQAAEWVGSQKGVMIGALPILAAFSGVPCSECSPYAPVSRLFWNEFYIDVEAVPEFATCRAAQRLVGTAAFQRMLNRFRASPLVDYPEEMAVRRRVLELLADDFFSKSTFRRQEFDGFVRARHEVEDYAAFRAICESEKGPWHSWNPRLRRGTVKKGDFDEVTKRYHLYVQWIVQEQIDRLSNTRTESPVRFYLDLPLGSHRDGYDVWRERESFALSASAGAPPDQFFSRGQDWGFAPLHPERIREQGYSYFRRVLAFHMRHARLLRIDHIMSLQRLYWLPVGGCPADGVYVKYNSEELCALLTLESHRHKTVVVGENLGTVPPEINQSMRRHHFRRMHVLEFSLKPDGAIAPPQPLTLTSVGTHDTPTFASFWRGDDIVDRAELGLLTADEAALEQKKRKKLIRAVEKRLRVPAGRRSLLESLRACLRFLAASKAEILLINLEDLWLEKAQQNVPGTTDQRPNWRRKARYTCEQVFRMGRIKQILREISKSRSSSSKS